MLDPSALERQLRVRWGMLPGIAQVRVRAVRGAWAILVDGSAATPPRGITSTVSVNVGERQPVVLPVYWRPVPAAAPRGIPAATAGQPGQPANDQMWAGVPPVVPRDMPMLPPTPPVTPPPMRDLPRARLEEYQLFLPARTPELPFWSRPFDLQSCLCCTVYGTQLGVISYAVESAEQLTLRSISYHAQGIPYANAIEVSVDRSGDEQATWRDIMVAPGGNTAKQFAFGSHLTPLPLNLIVDHDQTLNVRVKLLGPSPFNIGPPNPADAIVCVMLHGWISTLNDPRDGAPRAIDVGDLNDVAQGNLDIVSRFSDGELARGVQLVLHEGMEEILHPATDGRR